MKQQTFLQHQPLVIPQSNNQPLVEPIYQSVKFHTKTLAELNQAGEGRYVYSRVSNPTVAQLEQTLATLQGREDAIAVSSGISAVSTCLLSLLKTGDHVIMFIESYKPSRYLVGNLLARFGVTWSLHTLTDLESFETELSTRATRLVLFESPSNPVTRIADIDRITSLSRKFNALTILDNTLAGFHQHGQFNVDIFVHSLTKFASGHGDVMGGMIIGSADLISTVRTVAVNLGPVLDPHSAFLISRGLKTYFVRYREHSKNAQAVAESLEKNRNVSRVYYPGLESHPDRALAKQQMTEYGSVVAFEIVERGPTLETAIAKLNLFHLAPSLGSTESLVAPALMFFGTDLNPQQREVALLNNRVLRLSVGLEDVSELVADLNQALAGG